MKRNSEKNVVETTQLFDLCHSVLPSSTFFHNIEGFFHT